MVLRDLFSGSSSSPKSAKAKAAPSVASATTGHAPHPPGKGSSPSSQPHQNHDGGSLQPLSSGTALAPSNSYRFFLRRKTSRSSITPQTSHSSAASKDKASGSNSSSTSLGSGHHRFVAAPSAADTTAAPVTPDDSHSDHASTGSRGSSRRTQQDVAADHPADAAKSQHHHDGSSSSSSTIDKKHKKHPEHRNRHHHHHHLSLRRFLNKLKNPESAGTGAAKEKPVQDSTPTSSEILKKYGTIGKLLGTGASGSVNLVVSNTNPHQVYAVKKFRAKLPAESDVDYKVRVKNEFKIGEFSKHENLIHTYELIKDYPNGGSHRTRLIHDPEYYMVMEYCPYDFFNLVMSGLMSTEEIFCYFKHIVNGVAFLHQNGLAHRDLKLDNCVVNRDGILKLIDYGSAVQFKKEITSGAAINPAYDMLVDDSHKLVRARGVVGSDPYLAPEVLEPSNFGYDPRHADVWSVAVVFCCMVLKRFPWKIPKASDPSYRSFAGIEDVQDKKPVHESMSDLSLTTSTSSVKKTARGPDRLLRLLPGESRELVRRMLAIDPTKRYYMNDVVNDGFFKSIQHCHTVKDAAGHAAVFKPDNHTHHLVTEEELHKLNMERDRSRKLKEAGVT